MNNRATEENFVNKRRAHYTCHGRMDALRKTRHALPKFCFICVIKSLNVLLLIRDLVYQNNVPTLAQVGTCHYHLITSLRIDLLCLPLEFPLNGSKFSLNLMEGTVTTRAAINKKRKRF